MLAAVLTATELAPMCAVAAQSDHKRVLVLYSTRRDAEFSVVGETELPRILDAGLARNLDYYAEYLDLTRFPDPAYQEAFRDFLRAKYAGVRFDLVIAMQDVALSFLDEYRATLFGDTPSLFLTNDPSVTPRANSTGMIQERDFASTLLLVRRLQPDVRQVFIVTGAATTDRAYADMIRRQMPADPEVTFTYLSGLATADLEQRLAHLPDHSAIYYVLVSEDGAGNKFHPLEYVDRVAAAANAPTYSWVDSAMDHGIVGGSLYSQRATIDRVGDVALRILRGEPAASIPIVALKTNANQVDWRQLRRWGIDETRLPAGTAVRFRNPGAWERYRTYIVAALTLLITQSMLITGLLIQRQRRRRAENDLRTSERELQMTAERNRDLGVRLLRAQETERSRIARELHDDICQRMLLLTIELESLHRADPDEATAAAALTVAQEIGKSLHDLSHQLHPTRLRVIGLVAALDRLCSELSRHGFAVAFTHRHVAPGLPPDVMLCLFRVVQEALQNAIKHSGATEVSVDVRGGGGQITLAIHDNGGGFDIDSSLRNGVGLLSMVERVEAMGGSLDIRSTREGGTSLIATLLLSHHTEVDVRTNLATG